MPCTTLEIAGRNHFDVILELGDPASPLFAAARTLFGAASRDAYVTAARAWKRASRHSPDSSTCTRRSIASQTSTKRV